MNSVSCRAPLNGRAPIAFSAPAFLRGACLRSAPVLSLLFLLSGAAMTAAAAHGEPGDEGAATASLPTPLVTPLADIDVTYEVRTPDGQSASQRMRWNAAHWRQRLDVPGSGLVMLTDYQAHRLSVVDLRSKTFTVSGAPDTRFAPPGQAADGVWQKEADDRVAGVPCTHWTSTDTDGQEGDFCYSRTGVLLSASRGGVPTLRATAYAETPQGPSVFQEPSGFHEVKAVRLKP